MWTIHNPANVSERLLPPRHRFLFEFELIRDVTLRVQDTTELLCPRIQMWSRSRGAWRPNKVGNLVRNTYCTSMGVFELCDWRLERGIRYSIPEDTEVVGGIVVPAQVVVPTKRRRLLDL